LRYDWTKPLSDSSAWQLFDVGNISGLNARGFFGCVSDGQFIYFVPYYDDPVYIGKTVRYDTTMNFNDSSAWIGYNLDPTNGLPARGFKGGAFDGKYVYYAVSN